VIDPEGQREIQRIRDQIPILKEEPAYGERWSSWYKEASAVLANVYGVDSPELQGFMDIKFEIQRAVLSAQERLQEFMRRSTIRPVEDVQISVDRYFRERMSDAEEYLLSLRLPLSE
jgi:hypothetical protein